jgi:hypothetical protein
MEAGNAARLILSRHALEKFENDERERAAAIMESRSRDLEDKLKNLEEVLECPVCLSVPRPGTPVYECSNSHIICATCAEGIPDKKCPTCRVIFSVNKRNRIAEKLIVKLDLKVPCIHNERGCNHEERSSQIKDHETNCGSRPVLCPFFPFCDDEYEQDVNFDQFKDHAKRNHCIPCARMVQDEFRSLFTVEEKDFQNQPEASHPVRVQIYSLYEIDGQTYMPIMCKKQNTFRVMLYILAGKEAAQKHRVTISIEGKDYKASCTTKAMSIDIALNEAIMQEEHWLVLFNKQAKLCVSYDKDDDLPRTDCGMYFYDEDDAGGGLIFKYKVVKC